MNEAPADRSEWLLPLTLVNVPPGLCMMLAQEGVPTIMINNVEALRRDATRFVLCDGPDSLTRKLEEKGGDRRIVINLNQFRDRSGTDPFEAMIDDRSVLRSWRHGDITLLEHTAKFDKARLRERTLQRLSAVVREAGGMWMRVGPFPWPFRTAFNLRVDLDECDPADYWSFARAREPLRHCTTHFVSTCAYSDRSDVMADLKRLDTQSHGHFHHIYRDRAMNRANLRRAHALLDAAGITPVGFAGPGGRWNPGLDDALESLGYLYSSDFRVHYDDWPAFPWRGDRFSSVLQIPIHPVCEGLFFEAGASDWEFIANYYVHVLNRKVALLEPAFIYGHPERRLGRHPAIVTAIASAIESRRGVWQTTLTEFARWWVQRGQLRWGAWVCDDGRIALRMAERPQRALAIEVDFGEYFATVPMEGGFTMFHPAFLSQERKLVRFDAPSQPVAPRFSLKRTAREILDWEIVTPVDDLPERTPAQFIKKRMRLWKARRRAG